VRVTVSAPAKLNLSLDITSVRSDGYHILEMVMQSVELFDTVILQTGSETKGEINVICNNEDVPTGEENIVFAAAMAFFKETSTENPGITIKIKKNIPLSAGLAGGSADAAATLVGLNELFGTVLSKDDLCDIGILVGADVPFCIIGGTVLAEGIGGILGPLPPLMPCFFVIAKNCMKESTKIMYEKFDLLTNVTHPETNKIVEAICAGDLAETAKNLYNVFELVQAPEIEEIKTIMLNCDALGASLSGSGPAVFGIFTSFSAANKCANELKKVCADVFVCEPTKLGCEIED
jgi:4-diphosphocytidyl-2-C-methyl-D-erythritol kinase